MGEITTEQVREITRDELKLHLTQLTSIESKLDAIDKTLRIGNGELPITERLRNAEKDLTEMQAGETACKVNISKQIKIMQIAIIISLAGLIGGKELAIKLFSVMF